MTNNITDIPNKEDSTKIFQCKVSITAEEVSNINRLLDSNLDEIKRLNIPADVTLFDTYVEFENGYAMSIEVYTTCFDDNGEYRVSKNFYMFDANGDLIDDTWNSYKNSSDGILGEYTFIENTTGDNFIVNIVK